MDPRTLWRRRLCLLVCFLMIDATRSASSPVLHPPAVETGPKTPPDPARRRPLSAPIVVHDGRLVACSGKNLLAFEPNGSAAWTVPLGHHCNHGIRAITEKGKVFLVAEDKIMKVTPPGNTNSAHPASEVFFSYNATAGRSEEIIGIAISGGHSSLFVTIRNRGVFVLSLRGGLQWSLGPVLDRRGYRLGCRRNVSACYFDSAPVVGHCEGSLYISSTEGLLYSLSIHGRQYRWIQDMSSLDKVMTIAPGNSERIYIVFPRKSVVVGLDVSTGNISWRQSIGPLSDEKILPVVDSNGWMSIGTLDGNLYSISPEGDIVKFLQEAGKDSVIYASPVLDCSGFSMYVAQTIVEAKLSQKIGDYTYVSAMKKKSKRILFTLLAPATGTIHWTGEYPGDLSNLLPSSMLNDYLVDETILPTILSASRIGITMQCSTRGQKIAWTCGQSKAKFTEQGDYDHLLALMIFQFVVLAILAVAVRFCCIFWGKKKIQGNGLRKFVEKRCSLHNKRRVFGKMISHLERRTVEDTSSKEALERLGEMVKAKEGVERKLYTSYSLGRDRLGLKQDPSILPLYHGKYKSHSFHSSQKESITIFNALSDTSSSEHGSSSYSDDSGSSSCSASTSFGDKELNPRSWSTEEAGPSSSTDVADVMFVEGQSIARGGNVLSQKEEMMETSKDPRPSKRIMLKRRRTLSSTN